MGLLGKMSGRLPRRGDAETAARHKKRGLWVDVSGKAVHLDDEFVTGADIKRAAGLDKARILTVQGEDGPRTVKDDDRILVRPDDCFEDLPNWVYS
jgi:hypothetical protein